ncbi:hypothetical protein E1A91_D03G158800v1 [Gossypium mustelinum]|uniref:tRNA uridine(34) hydroxylase N-terminal domain-containing protein n=1 Tax=Gossypium mustelinum TaxID=34275 RepID=A0A5D2VNA9_GOSMU|nr:hypothetical protein E1A91_D03G158800v1 [Gossypium mustelinum]
MPVEIKKKRKEKKPMPLLDLQISFTSPINILERLHVRGLDIHGRICINEQGINAQYSGPSKHSFAYVEWLKEDDRFSDILVQTSPAFNGHAFPKLKLRYKPSLVQVNLISSE